MNRIARRIGRHATRRPLLTIAVWLVLAAAALTAGAAFGDEFVDDLTASGSDSAAALSLLEERFPEAAGGSALAVFAVRGEGDLTTHDRPEPIAAALARLRDVPHVRSVSDPFADRTISADRRVAFASIVLDVPDKTFGVHGVEELEEAVAPLRDNGLLAEIGGDAPFLNSVPETSGAEAVGLVAALAVLVISFGSVAAALLPVGLALVVVGTGLGLITLSTTLGNVASDAPTIATMIGLGVGIDYALFVVARYREEVRAGRPRSDALDVALETSGASVVFAGGTVVVAMASLVLTGVGVLGSMGLAASVTVLVAVSAAVSLLPAVLVLGGRRLAGPGRGVQTSGDAPGASRWWRHAHRIAARPVPYLAASVTLLALFGAPIVRMELGMPDAGTEPVETTHRRAYDLLAEGFGPGFNGPLHVVADLDGAEAPTATLADLVATVSADPGVAFVGEPAISPDGTAAILAAVPTTGPSDPATEATTERLRRALPAGVLVGGMTATIGDLTDQISHTLPVFIAAVVAASFLLLVLVYRSLLVPLKAALMNLLSIAGAYGVMVAVFQWGWLAGPIGVEAPLPIAPFIPVLMFAVLFGLSMDYEVFLLSRIREGYDVTGDDAESVARGLAGTGRIITAAALIMISVFASFVTSPSPILKMVGLGLATAIAIDATVVRMVLVPATMTLMGRANWWLPGWIDRRLPRLDIETSSAVEPALALSTDRP